LRALKVFKKTIDVMLSIELDDQPCSHANEIHDKPAQQSLPPKSITAQAPIAQVIPEASFGIG